MEAAGLPTPRNMLITSADMLDKVGWGTARAGRFAQPRGTRRCRSAGLPRSPAAGPWPPPLNGGPSWWQAARRPAHQHLSTGSQAADHVGFPAVIKPIHGAASLGVLRVDSKESLAAAYDKVGGRAWWAG